MKTTTRIGIIAIAAVLVALLGLGIYSNIAINNFLESNGFHILGKRAHIDLQAKGFVVHAGGTAEGAVGTETTITISALIHPPKSNDSMSGMTGWVNVEAYPLAVEDATRGMVGIVEKDRIYIHNHYLKLLHGECEREYTVDILRSDPSVIVVTISDDTSFVIVVSGNTEEEAKQSYTRYLES